MVKAYSPVLHKEEDNRECLSRRGAQSASSRKLNNLRAPHSIGLMVLGVEVTDLSERQMAATTIAAAKKLANELRTREESRMCSLSNDQ